MKKMNRKGFTLIELLAVIVVLAIILVITIPTVLNMVGNTRSDAFGASANAAAEWFEKQAALVDAGLDGANTDFKTWYSTNKDKTTGVALNANLLKAAGLNDTDYSTTSTLYFENGRACVTLVPGSEGKFSSVSSTDSSGCP